MEEAVTKRHIYIMSIALVLSIIGAAFKLYGGIVYQSKAVIVDGITCIANIVAGAVIIASMIKSRMPPDIDHPYGHQRIVYIGILVLLLSYAFSAGLSVGVLLQSQRYEVQAESAVYALLGAGVYAISVFVSSKASTSGESYAFFTFSEVLEGIVSAGAAYAGAELSYLIDYAGAVLITGYIFVELYNESKKLNIVITDRVRPQVFDEIYRLLEERGFKIKRLRLRPLSSNNYVGDAIVEAPGVPADVSDLLAEEAIYYAKRLGVDLTIHIDVAKHEEPVKK